MVQRRVTVPAPRRARYNDVEEDFRVVRVLDLTLEKPARPPPDHRSTACHAATVQVALGSHVSR